MSSGCGTNTPLEKTETGYQNEARSLEKALRVLGEKVSLLEKRLQPALSPIGTINDKCKEAPTPAKSELENFLSEMTTLARNNYENIQSFLDRICL